jgi:methylated-DNA-[protein]-cysteine S-methyltransferase
VNTELGHISIKDSVDGVNSVSFHETTEVQNEAAERQLREYFNGQRVNFDLNLDPHGTLFQKQVWDEMQKIPFGETASYAEVAKRVGRPEAWRAVANACGANPILIIIPCHRVVGSHGRLGGYAAGIDRKLWLLEHEAKIRSRIERK